MSRLVHPMLRALLSILLVIIIRQDRQRCCSVSRWPEAAAARFLDASDSLSWPPDLSVSMRVQLCEYAYADADSHRSTATLLHHEVARLCLDGSKQHNSASPALLERYLEIWQALRRQILVKRCQLFVRDFLVICFWPLMPIRGCRDVASL